MTTTAKKLWQPSAERIADAGITRYRHWLKQTRGLQFDHYDDLWQWSTTHIEEFWESIWQFGGVIAHSPYQQVLKERKMPGARWFEGATLNYAEHALAYGQRPENRDKPAIIAESEVRGRTEMGWGQLRQQTAAVAAMLKAQGLHSGERAVAYMPNIPETAVAMLATVSLGGIWSCTAPDMGAVGVLDRFRQIAPRVLFAIDGYRYGGRDFDRRDIVKELVRQLPSVQTVVFLRYLNADATLDLSDLGRDITVLDFANVCASTDKEPEFVAVPFSHPLWIVYSSGTTGMPKPIVHGHGGVVIQTFKAGLLHADAKAGDRAFWFSSTNWIMWNSTLNGLINGVTILIFDGNPGYPDTTTLWRFAEREKATSFGTSPAFIALCSKAGINPGEQFDLSSLKSVGCTGSPLPEEGYEWVYSHVKKDVRLGCISGGTDPGACFLTTCSILPIYSGEMQCRELGIATHAFNDDGQSVIDEVGELVVTQPMPSMPLFFWGDDDGSRYFSSYFEQFPGVWCHGDWVRLIPRPEAVTGIIYGRSDSTINRHGIRMGTSEIYRVVEEFDEVLDSLVVDLEYLNRESFMALFIVLRDKSASETPEALRQAINAAIRSKLSARHVPDGIFVIPEVPRTLSGKKLEIPVKKILLGHDERKAVNRDSMANPASIDWFLAFARQREQERAREGQDH